MAARRTVTTVTAIALQWLALTVALASVVVHAGAALDDYVSPNLDGLFIFLAAFLLAGLLGMTVESPKVLVPLTFGMCITASAIYGGVIYSPVWLDISTGSVTLQNYASEQALLIFLWTLIPAITGALTGYLTRGDR